MSLEELMMLLGIKQPQNPHPQWEGFQGPRTRWVWQDDPNQQPKDFWGDTKPVFTVDR